MYRCISSSPDQCPSPAGPGLCEQVGLAPHLGVWGAYSKRSDPWQARGPRSFMRQFYRKTLAWLKRGVRGIEWVVMVLGVDK